MKQMGLFGDDKDLVVEMRRNWRELIEREGGHCPICDRWGKVYARSINKTMARSLVWLCYAKPADENWVDVPSQAPRWLVRSNQLPTLRWWGMVERRTNDDEHKKFSGMWRPTPFGLLFVEGKTTAPKKVYTYNGEVEGVCIDTVKIHECFKDFFDYEATMKEMR